MTDRTKHSTNIIILIVLAFFFLMFGNQMVSLTHPDEVFYVQTAKEMISHKSWSTSYIFDKPQFEKPILFYWLLAAAIKVFGLVPFAARFWPSFFGITGVVVTYGLAFLLFGKKRIAFLSGIVLSTSFIYLALSRSVLTDMVFSILTVLSVTFFYYSYSFPERKNRGIMIGFVFCALAVLTKGILGILFPVSIFFTYLIYKKDLKFLWCPSTLWGLAAFVIIAAPWHIQMYRAYGQTFIDEYWRNVHVRRIFDAEHQKSNTWHFYPMTMFGGIFPWSFFLIPAIWFSAKEVKDHNKDRDKIIFLFLMIATVWLGMQMAASKLASYIFPVFPPIAILIGYYLNKAFENKEGKEALSLRIAAYFFSVFLAGGAVAGIFFGYQYIDFIQDMRIVYLIALLLVIIGSSIFLFFRYRKYIQGFLTVCAVTSIVLIFVLAGRQYAEPWVSCKSVCEMFKEIDRGDSTVLCAKFYVRGVKFYTDRKVAVIDINGKGFYSPHPIPFLNTDGKVIQFLKAQPVTYGILKESNIKDLERIIRGRFAMKNLYNIGGKYIVRIEKNDS